jgi:6-phosphogluconolactonase
MAVPGGSALAMMAGLEEAVHGGKLVAVEWSKVHLAYVNHKCVPLDDERSNHRKALEIFANKVGIPSDHIVTPGGSSDGRTEAAAYQKSILALDSAVLPKDEDGTPVFDVLLLGMGSDGHVGSLYPGRSEITRRDAYVLHVEQEGKPPSITFSLPVMNAAKEVVVLALGAEKAKTLEVALKEDAGDSGKSCPAQAVHPKEVSTWILDADAAELL